MLKKVILFIVIVILIIFLTTSTPSVNPDGPKIQIDNGMLGEPAK